jgi:WXG100 family type VII secretion target
MGNDGGTSAPTPGVSVVPDDVRSVGRKAYELAQALRSALNDAGREVDSLTSSGWTGSAAAAFATGWGECHDGGNQIIDALIEMAERLGVSAANYQTQDTRAASATSSLDL